MSESSITFNADDPQEQIQEALDERVMQLYLPGRIGSVAIHARYFAEHPDPPEAA